MKAALMAQAVETGPTNDSDSRHATVPAKPQNPVDDDNTPSRTLVNIVSYVSAPEVVTKLPMQPTVQPDTPSARPLSTITPTRQRKLHFSEKVPDPGDPNSPTVLYITEDGKIPTAYDPFSTAPNIVVHQGDVEDWLIENRSQETHAFHIHQTHFLVLERHGVPVHESYLRDTINVPYWDGFSPQYPSIKLRMDFRDKNIVGTFPYHCHILQHDVAAADRNHIGLVCRLQELRPKLPDQSDCRRSRRTGFGHAGYSDPVDEQTFLVQTINRLQQSPEWRHLAIVIAYDFTDQSSILRFIEDNWDLGQLGGGSSDAKAGKLDGLFDFGNDRKSRLLLDPQTGQVVSNH